MNLFKKTNQKVLLFIGGVAFSTIASSFVKSKSCKKICVKTLAKSMRVKDEIEHRIATIKEEAEDLYNEAKVSAETCECCREEETNEN